MLTMSALYLEKQEKIKYDLSQNSSFLDQQMAPWWRNFGVKILVQLLFYINFISANLKDLQMGKMVHTSTKPVTKQ